MNRNTSRLVAWGVTNQIQTKLVKSPKYVYVGNMVTLVGNFSGEF